MKTVVAVTVAVLLAMGVATTWAEEIQGKVQQIDQTDRVLVLEDGTKIWVAEGVSMDAMKEGATVKASYEERDGKKVATSLEVSE